MRVILVVLWTLPLFASSVHIYVANSDDNKISVIDPAADKVVREIPVSPNPHGIVPSPDGGRFYVSSESKDLLDVVDRKNSTIIRRIPLGTRPNNVAITADGKRVYICIRGESWVDIVDTVSLEKVKSVPVGHGPHNVYRTPDDLHMIATSMDENKLTVINVKTEEPELTIPIKGVPRPLAIESNADRSIKRLFVQLSSLHGFAVIDYASRMETRRVLLPDAPPGARPLIPATFSHGMAISPDNKTLWVASMLDNSVVVFSLSDLSRITTIPVGRGPDWLTFTPDGTRCYVSNAGANSVSSIDVKEMKELTRIPVGKVPKRIIASE
ncbi:MAG: beta-propeller repeat protein [Bryobacterales bacterium]|nr:beta-propeller repeat protein [Bryobacterales bacterium]